MLAAAFAGGFACGLSLALVLFLLAIALAAASAWRFSSALEKQGLTIHINEPKVTEAGPQ
jgi:hypothetical protein